MKIQLPPGAKLTKACSKRGDSRFHAPNPFIQNGSLLATDGRILVCWPDQVPELREAKRSVSREVVERAERDKWKYPLDLSESAGADSYEGLALKVGDKEPPNVQAVVSDLDNGELLCEVALDVELLKRLCESMAVGNAKGRQIKLTIRSRRPEDGKTALAPIKVEPLKHVTGDPVGVIMPITISGA